MSLSKEVLGSMLEKHLERSPQYKNVFEVIKRNSLRPRWLIGGAVYRPLVQMLYRHGELTSDYDFIVRQRIDPLYYYTPTAYELKYSRVGSPRWQKGDLTIDIVQECDLHTCHRLGIEPCVRNFIDHTPLTIQSMVYDLEHKVLEGDVGIQALQNKTVAVLDRGEAEYHAGLHGWTVEEYVQDKARSLGFKAIL